MNISYSQPLSQAWLRMKLMLFRPFDIGTWFALGFTAFLAGLAESGSSANVQYKKFINDDVSYDGIGDMVQDFGATAQDFLQNGLGLGLALLGGFVLISLYLLLLWLSSRGQFMFLDNLVHRRTAISRPWQEFAAQADSLFLWQIIYTLVLMAIVGLCVLFGFSLFGPLMIGDVSWMVVAPLVILAGTIVFILAMAMIYTDFFLTAFVVPIMHKERIGTMAAWSRFITIFREHPGNFFLAGLFYLIINVASTIAIVFAGLLTCCIGFLLMAIPYVGSVIILPVSVLTRYFTLDFLGQFGDEFSLLDQPDETPLADLNNHRTVIRTEDIGENGSTDEPGPESSRD